MSMSLEQAALLAPALKPFSGPAALYGSLDALAPSDRKARARRWQLPATSDGRRSRPTSCSRAAAGRRLHRLLPRSCKPGDRVGVEPLTYPAITRLAVASRRPSRSHRDRRRGDRHRGLAKVHRAKPLAALTSSRRSTSARHLYEAGAAGRRSRRPCGNLGSPASRTPPSRFSRCGGRSLPTRPIAWSSSTAS